MDTTQRSSQLTSGFAAFATIWSLADFLLKKRWRRSPPEEQHVFQSSWEAGPLGLSKRARALLLSRQWCGNIFDSSPSESCCGIRKQNTAFSLCPVGSCLCRPPPSEAGQPHRCFNCTPRADTSHCVHLNSEWPSRTFAEGSPFMARLRQDSEIGEACPGPDTSTHSPGECPEISPLPLPLPTQDPSFKGCALSTATPQSVWGHGERAQIVFPRHPAREL